MKKMKLLRTLLTVCIIFGLCITPMSQMIVHADEDTTTVYGTILSGTTAELLQLQTQQGKMEIKMDSSTDACAAKVLLIDTKVYIAVKHGSDGYMHAVRITKDLPSLSSVIDKSNNSTVNGTLSEKSREGTLFLTTAQGEMELKYDSTTDMSGVSILVPGKGYKISCARGNDAYMHAISVCDSGSSYSYYSGNVNSYAASGTVTSHSTYPSISSDTKTMSVKGEVGDDTKENLLYLKTEGGTMQFIIDMNADTIDGLVLVPDNELTVTFYNGSDGYLHAMSIKGEKDELTASIDKSSLSTVTGTVKSSSTEKILYLDTTGGKMDLKLDAVNSITNSKVLVSGKKISVTCAYGSDAYMHAIDITAQ